LSDVYSCLLMNRTEAKVTVVLSLIQALRMLGMFMILPVFALYARDLPQSASPAQVGWAIGLYGLVQAVLQIPFGIASDRLGRKPVIIAGLVIFAIGSWVAGATHDIHWIMFGRALQGAGAISGAVSALLADVTRVQVRTQAMAVMGIGMGMSFIIALILGPVLSGVIGVNGIFDLTGWLAFAAIPVVAFFIPSVPRTAMVPGSLRRVLTDPQLLRLDGGIFLLHMMMTALFIAAPHAIEDTLGIPARLHWHVYLPILLISVLLVFPMIRRIEKRGKTKVAFIGAVALLGIALLIAAAEYRAADGLYAGLLLFFLGFNYLEGSLPSLISRRAPVQQKGAALGIYASSQFLGGFCGAKLGGFAYAMWGVGGVFGAAALLSLIWLSFAIGLAPLPQTHEGAESASP